MVSTEEVINIGFNQDSSCITLSSENSSESSVRVYNTQPLKYLYQRGKK